MLGASNAMFTPVTISSTVTLPPLSQSPTHLTGAALTAAAASADTRSGGKPIAHMSTSNVEVIARRSMHEDTGESGKPLYPRQSTVNAGHGVQERPQPPALREILRPR